MEKALKNTKIAVNDIPRVPIKTYQWEDVRRSRRKGGYPWTHISKSPYDEDVDPEEFTMEAFRRSRSSSTLGKSETQDLGDITQEMIQTEHLQDEELMDKTTNIDEQQALEMLNGEKRLTPEMQQQPGPSELLTPEDKPISKNGKEKRASSEEPKRKRKLSIQSSYSRMSLPKFSVMSKLKDAKNKLKVPKLPKRSKSDVTEDKIPKKTKSKSEISEKVEIKKTTLTTAPKKTTSPVYIHIPLKPPPGETDEYSKYEFEEPEKPSKTEIGEDQPDSPNVMGEIGQRKLSLLDVLYELKKAQESTIAEQPTTTTPKKTKKINLKLKTKRKDSKTLVKTIDNETLESSKTELNSKEVDKSKKKSQEKDTQENISKETNNTEKVTSIEQETIRSTLIVPGANDEKGMNVNLMPQLERMESIGPVIQEITENESVAFKEKAILETPGRQKSKTPEPIVVEPEDSSADDNISQYLDKDDTELKEIEKGIAIDQPGPSKNNDESTNIDQTSDTSQTSAKDIKNKFKITVTTLRQERARSEEPKRKRKLSIESGHSRKSLSKLGLLKKLKEAKDKIKLPKFPSFSKSDNKEIKKESMKSKVDKTKSSLPEEKKSTSKKDHKTNEGPMYIHIPLKPPPGKTDEYSKYAEEIKEIVNPIKDTPEDDESMPATPDSPTNDVQLIILTPPSDDEILDSCSNAPDTPSESDQKFFYSMRIEELKTLAKKAADQVYPDTKTTLEPVKEETDEGSLNRQNSIKKKSTEELSKRIVNDNQESPKTDTDSNELKDVRTVNIEQKKPLVDEEDGLPLNATAIALINEELAKEKLPPVAAPESKENETKTLKPDGSPPLKKKVSFKRKSRGEDGERIYEDVQIFDSTKKDDNDKKILVDEKTSHFSDELGNGTSLEDDKWSKSIDHEYEPVNPPADGTSFASPLTMHIVDTTGAHQIKESVAVSNSNSLERRNLRNPTNNTLEMYGPADIEEAVVRHVSTEKIQTEGQSLNPADNKLNTDHAGSSELETLSLKAQKENEKQGKTLNETIKTQAGKLKTRIQNIKKPNLKILQRPKSQSPNLKKKSTEGKSKFTMPKLPNLPSFSLPRKSDPNKSTTKRSWRERQFSTESNAGDSKKKFFDFATYPRIFDKTKKSKKSEGHDKDFTKPNDEAESSKDSQEPTTSPEFATFPRTNRKKGPVGSRWMSKFRDNEFVDEYSGRSKETDRDDDRDIIRIPLHPEHEPDDIPSHTRYNQDIDIDDEYDRENRDIHRASPYSKDYLKRWTHGEFHKGPTTAQVEYEPDIRCDDYRITDLDNDMQEPQTPPDENFDMEITHAKEIHSSGSLSDHRRGVLEEIDSDEFFLREKGISQENIEVGKYLSSEIREAFRNPINALSQIQHDDYNRKYEVDESDQSENLHDVSPRRKPLKKPKRKKTPHVSREEISFDKDSESEQFPKPFDNLRSIISPPARPKRRSKKGKKTKKSMPAEVIPYQETIPVHETFEPVHSDEITREIESQILPDNILGDEIHENGYTEQYNQQLREYPQMYENEQMAEIQQPNIMVSSPYYRYENYEEMLDEEIEPPVAPARKQRSLKSLNASEHDSITNELCFDKDLTEQEMEAYRAEHEYIIPTPEPPIRSKRTQSQSLTKISQPEEDATSRGADSPVSDNQVPCVEEPCIEKVCDSMGYAVIDKQKPRDPPLPPTRFPLTPPRTRKVKKSDDVLAHDNKFFTVPRSHDDQPPPRPLRNYSTLGGPSRPPRKKTSSSTNVNEEEKENINLSQYIEIEEEDEPSRNLQSGEIIQKMRGRPLPAPPRPPRKTKDSTKEVLRDITQESNILTESKESDLDKFEREEIEISTQTEALPDNYFSDEPNDPSQFEQETITHGAIILRHIDNSNILSHSYVRQRFGTDNSTTERIIPITIDGSNERDVQDYDQKIEDEEETSEIPDYFKNLENPQISEMSVQTPMQVQQPTQEVQFTNKSDDIPSRQIESSTEIHILKAQQLQVGDLDVDKLRVNELQANKIFVSEMEGISLQVSEINSKSGNLVVSGIELSQQVIQELIDKLQSVANEQSQESVTSQSAKPTTQETDTQIFTESAIEESQNQDIEQKKTPISEPLFEPLEDDIPQRPLRQTSKNGKLIDNQIKETEFQTDNLQQNYLESNVENQIVQEATYTENKKNSNQSVEDTVEHIGLLSQEVEKEIDQILQMAAQTVLSRSTSPQNQLETNQNIPHTEELQTIDSDLEKEIIYEEDREPPKRPPRKSVTEKIQETVEQPEEHYFTEHTIVDNMVLLDDRFPQFISDIHLPLHPNLFPENEQQIDNSSRSEEELPPRPPQPPGYFPSQPPPSFYALRSPHFIEFLDDDIPLPPRRKRHHKVPVVSRSSSDEVPQATRRPQRSSEASIPQLTGQLVRACGTSLDRSIKRLISHISNNVLQNADGKQDLHVIMVILLVLIAGILLLNSGDGKVIHHHHWEFFNPPGNL